MMTLALTTVALAVIGIAIKIVSASVVAKRALTVAVVTDVRNAVLVTLTVSATAKATPVVLAEKRRTATATPSPVRVYAGQTARVKRQDAEIDVIVTMGHQTPADRLLAAPMMKAVYDHHPPWERLLLPHLLRRLLCPAMKTALLAVGALEVESVVIVTKTETVSVSAVVSAVVTETTIVTVAARDTASVDVPTPKTTTVMEMHEARGWEVTTNALVVEREILREMM